MPSPSRRSRSQAVVLLPTYDEIANLPTIIPAILDAAPVDVMILDDASPDGTGHLAATLAKAEPRLSVVHRQHKAGLGAAYVDGFQRALAQGYRFIIEMDADFSHPPEALVEMLQLAHRSDVVLGSRWIAGGGTQNWPLKRRLLSRAGSFYARTVLGVKVRDLTGGFKCFRREVLEAIDLASITTSGYAFQIELTYRAIKAGFSVREFPITFVERSVGDSKMSGSIMTEALTKIPMLRLQEWPDQPKQVDKKPG